MSGVAALLTLGVGGCDEGRIYDEPSEGDFGGGGTATLTGSVRNVDEWPEGYTLAIAGFGEGDDYASIVKNVHIGDDGVCDEVMSGIPADVSSVELCVVDRLRRRVVSYVKAAYDASRPEVRLQADDIDVSMTGAVQDEIFSPTCANCHGAAGHAAASLFLTPGKSRDNLVGVPSTVVEGETRVVGGNADASLLYQILTGDMSSSWHYDHSVEVIDPVKINLLRDWIEGGINNNL